MFEVITASKVSHGAVSQIFEDCGGCFGIALDFEASKDKTMSAKDRTHFLRRISPKKRMVSSQECRILTRRNTLVPHHSILM